MKSDTSAFYLKQTIHSFLFGLSKWHLCFQAVISVLMIVTSTDILKRTFPSALKSNKLTPLISNLYIGQNEFENLPKRRLILEVIQYLCKEGVTPEKIKEIILFKNGMFYSIEEALSGSRFRALATEEFVSIGKKSDRIVKRYFSDDEQLIRSNGGSYALTKMCGTTTEKALQVLKYSFPQLPFGWECE